MELVLGGAAEAAVRADWERLRRAGLPSQGRHTDVANRPHVTLALTESVDDLVHDRLAAIAAGLPLPLTVGAPIVFGHRRFILGRLIVPERGLLGLQQRAWGALDEPVDRHDTFRLGGWTPHVTLGRRFSAEQVGAALTALGPVRPVTGPGARVRLWDIGAHRERWV